MSDYQKALEAARRLLERPNWDIEGLLLHFDPQAESDTKLVADMLLRNHAISHGEPRVIPHGLRESGPA